MFSKFQQIYDAFLQAGMDNPLQEMLSMLDSLNSGVIRQIERTLPNEDDIDLPQLLEKRLQGIP